MGHSGRSSELESMQQLEGNVSIQLHQLDPVLVQYSSGRFFPFSTWVSEISTADMVAHRGCTCMPIGIRMVRKQVFIAAGKSSFEILMMLTELAGQTE